MTELPSPAAARRPSSTSGTPPPVSTRNRVSTAGGGDAPQKVPLDLGSLFLPGPRGGNPIQEAIQSLAQDTLVRYQALLSSGTLNVPSLNVKGLAGVRPFHLSPDPHTARPRQPQPYQSAAPSFLGNTDQKAMYNDFHFGIDLPSMSKVRLGLLGASATASASVSASGLVSEHAADGDLRSGINRLKERLARQQHQFTLSTLPTYSDRATLGGATLQNRQLLAPHHPVVTAKDREVVLDPVTRQLVDVGPSSTRNLGFEYTTLEDTMRLIRAHRGGGPVGVAWG